MSGDREIIELESDSEGEYYLAEELPHLDPQYPQFPAFDGIFEEDKVRGEHDPAFEADVIDLTNIPDVDVPPSKHASPVRAVKIRGFSPGPTELITEAACLQMILDVLPDISVDHVLTVIRKKTKDVTLTFLEGERIITHILDDESYPKEADEAKHKKRKRTEDEEWSSFEMAEPDATVPTYEADALELLKDEFPAIPVRHIINVLKDQRTLFKAYKTLEEQSRNYNRIANNFSKIGKARIKRGVEAILIERGSQLPKELHAAKRKVESEMVKRRKAVEAERAEVENLKRAQEMNEMGECACCFDDVPLNRMIGCNGDTIHLYCIECPKRQIETMIGQSRCQIQCFGVDDCEGTFTRRQLQQVLDEKTFDRLEHLQQQADLAAAGLDFLSECPFCDFKMECLPVEVDKEFRCQSTKCGKTSCRLCQKETHIPLSCEEAKKDGQLTMRHIVEEAMSAALIRQCNRCKHPFVKEYGCNKMTCSHCKNVQCYICSKNVVNYGHFGEADRGRCPLHENVEDRHEKEVKAAAEEAMAKVRSENPDLSDADLMVQVSDRVKKSEDARKNRAQADARQYPYIMVNAQLHGRAPAAPPQPLRAGQVEPPPLPPDFLPPPPVQGPAIQYVPVHAQVAGANVYNAQPVPFPPAPFLVGHIAPVPFPPMPPLPVGPPLGHAMPHPHGGFLQQDPAQPLHQPNDPHVHGYNHIWGVHGPGIQPVQQVHMHPRNHGHLAQPAQHPPLPPPPPLYVEALPVPRAGPPVNADVLQQRMNHLQQQQQNMAQALHERRARILALQRDNLDQQRALLLNELGAVGLVNQRRHHPAQGQPPPRRQ